MGVDVAVDRHGRWGPRGPRPRRRGRARGRGLRPAPARARRGSRLAMLPRRPPSPPYPTSPRPATSRGRPQPRGRTPGSRSRPRGPPPAAAPGLSGSVPVSCSGCSSARHQPDDPRAPPGRPRPVAPPCRRRAGGGEPGGGVAGGGRAGRRGASPPPGSPPSEPSPAGGSTGGQPGGGLAPKDSSQRLVPLGGRLVTRPATQPRLVPSLYVPTGRGTYWDESSRLWLGLVPDDSGTSRDEWDESCFSGGSPPSQ